MRPGAAVLWRMHLARAPADALLRRPAGESGGDCTFEDGRDGGGGRRAAVTPVVVGRRDRHAAERTARMSRPGSASSCLSSPSAAEATRYSSTRCRRHPSRRRYSHGATHADYVKAHSLGGRTAAAPDAHLLGRPGEARRAWRAHDGRRARNASGAPAPPTDGAARVVFEAYPLPAPRVTTARGRTRSSSTQTLSRRTCGGPCRLGSTSTTWCSTVTATREGIRSGSSSASATCARVSRTS